MPTFRSDFKRIFSVDASGIVETSWTQRGAAKPGVFLLKDADAIIPAHKSADAAHDAVLDFVYAFGNLGIKGHMSRADNRDAESGVSTGRVVEMQIRELDALVRFR